MIADPVLLAAAILGLFLMLLVSGVVGVGAVDVMAARVRHRRLVRDRLRWQVNIGAKRIASHLKCDGKTSVN